MTGKRVGVDTATRMAMDADFNDRGEPSTQERAPMLKMDQIDELIRILGEQGIEPEPPGAAPTCCCLQIAAGG